MRVLIVLSMALFPALRPLSGQEATTHGWPVKILQRLLVPLRSNPFSQRTFSPCEFGLANCFLAGSATRSRLEFHLKPAGENSYRPVMLEVRTDHGGPMAHHWLELESQEDRMTIGFGPATLPFIDSGQVSLQDRYGNIVRISGMHPLPWLALPPINYHYAPGPNEGRIIGERVPLTAVQSQRLIRKLQHLKFVGPYIPIFHDCRTFTCAMVASAQGHSTVPCYLLFKGYW